MVKTVLQVFALEDAICGISNDGIDTDEYSFTFRKEPDGTFETFEECGEYVAEKLKDYKKRNVGQNARFVILPVHCFENDKLFKVSEK